MFNRKERHSLKIEIFLVSVICMFEQTLRKQCVIYLIYIFQ